jgi:hypothetical protein
VAEATSPSGTVVGAVFTFVLYGVAPVSLLLYLLGRRGGKDESSAPDGGGETGADAVPTVREEP